MEKQRLLSGWRTMLRGPLVLFLLALAGCAAFRPTTEQQLARAAWESCPKAANLALTSIDPNGLIHYRAVSSQSGARTLAECLRSTGASVSSAPVVNSSP
jgi:hypothetical protein